jgi:sugar phosphate isomerase/epimerase
LTDLICSYFTVAGVSPVVGNSVSLSPFSERVQACAAAGYSGIGMHVRDYLALRRQGATDKQLRAVLDDNGIRHVEVEFLLNWFADGVEGELARKDEATLYHMVEIFGARAINLGGDMTPRSSMPLEQLVEPFAALCARASEHGVTLAVEPVPWGNIAYVEDALRLIGESSAKNAGVLLDVWHLYRGGFEYQDLRGMDPALIVAVQLDDAKAEMHGDLMEDTVDHRVLPGQGAARPAEFLAILEDIGVSVPISVEILSTEQRGLAPAEAARVSYDAAVGVIERAGYGLDPRRG